MKIVSINGKDYEVIIHRKRIKNIYLRVKDDCLEVTCPYYVLDFEVMKFIESKKVWIAKVNIKKNINSKLKVKDTIFYRGEEYKLVIIDGHSAIKIDEDNKTIYIRCKGAILDKALQIFYEHGKKILLKDVLDIQDKYLRILEDYGYDRIPDINIKYLKSMWGVCYNRKNKINLSARLIHFDKESLEAILWHELLHFVIPNHSKRYHEVIELYMPRYNEIVKNLR